MYINSQRYYQNKKRPWVHFTLVSFDVIKLSNNVNHFPIFGSYQLVSQSLVLVRDKVIGRNVLNSTDPAGTLVSRETLWTLQMHFVGWLLLFKVQVDCHLTAGQQRGRTIGRGLFDECGS